MLSPTCSYRPAIGGMRSDSDGNPAALNAAISQAQDAAKQVAQTLCPADAQLDHLDSDVLLRVQRLMATELEEGFMVRHMHARAACLHCHSCT